MIDGRKVHGVCGNRGGADHHSRSGHGAGRPLGRQTLNPDGEEAAIIKIKRVYDEPSSEDGWRVLVDRLWPRGMTKKSAHIDLWLKDVAPSNELRRWFGHNPAKWGGFQKKYRAELRGKKDTVANLQKLEKEHATMTLLFGAKDEKHNQAVVLAGLLKGG